MTKNRMNPRVDAFLSGAERWREEMRRLRAIILRFPLAEELKWGKPCYTLEGKNVVIIIGFKDSCALMFCKGALLKDTKGLLLKPGENTQAGRWIKFTSVREIAEREPLLKAYISEAIEAEKSGREVKFKKSSGFKIPGEFKASLEERPALRAAFEALTPGRQRAYILYFSAAKQSKTRSSRIEKCTPLILQGKGLIDDYLARRSR
jgi:uncharacterized protein YdeI (YjbR/CyaY-like superfamily)